MTLYDGFMSVMTSVWSFETGVFDCCRYLTKATTHTITVQKFRANWSRRFRVIAPYSGFRTLHDGFKSVATSILELRNRNIRLFSRPNQSNTTYHPGAKVTEQLGEWAHSYNGCVGFLLHTEYVTTGTSATQGQYDCLCGCMRLKDIKTRY